jgi:hypothetical protein
VEEMENATITQFYFDFENGPIIMPEIFSQPEGTGAYTYIKLA